MILGKAGLIYKLVLKKVGGKMKCPACGREMIYKGTHFDCSNFLCDYVEEIENREIRVPALLLKNEIPITARVIK